MNPLDLPQLDWDDFRANPAVGAAYHDLIEQCDRPVALHNRSLVPGIENCFRAGWQGGIHIFIDPESRTLNHSLVHEILHEILIAEGYSQIDNIPKYIELLPDILSNEMQHPEIFRRMQENYRLDEMEVYWDEWRIKMRRSVDNLKKQARDRDWWLIHFPRVYTWFFQEVSKPYLAEYGACCPILYQAVKTAADESEQFGFSTAEKHRQSIELLREHWLRFSERNLPRDPYGPPPHTLIVQSTIRPMIGRDRTVTGDNLMALLHNYGLEL